MIVSQSLQDALLAWALGIKAMPPSPAGLFLSLHNSEACDGSDEIHSWEGGSRLALQAADLEPVPADEGAGWRNARALLFGRALSPERVHGFAIWDSAAASEAGNLLFRGLLDEPCDLAPGNPPLFFAGSLALSLI